MSDINVVTAKNPYTRPLKDTVLKQGDLGDFVAWLQWELRRSYTDLKVNGKFDYVVKVAVMKYQNSIGIVPDGVAWPNIIDSFEERSKGTVEE